MIDTDRYEYMITQLNGGVDDGPFASFALAKAYYFSQDEEYRKTRYIEKRMIDTDKYTEQSEEGDFITITGIVTKLYFEELMDGRESFHGVEWDIKEYDEDAPPLFEEVKRLREGMKDMLYRLEMEERDAGHAEQELEQWIHTWKHWLREMIE